MRKKQMTALVDSIINRVQERANASDEPGVPPLEEEQARGLLGRFLQVKASEIVDQVAGVLPEAEEAEESEETALAVADD